MKKLINKIAKEIAIAIIEILVAIFIAAAEEIEKKEENNDNH